MTLVSSLVRWPFRAVVRGTLCDDLERTSYNTMPWRLRLNTVGGGASGDLRSQAEPGNEG
ncbi:hypothetical protein Mal15_67880 [Stieleria maiorica]|uniref:Uncharacterized protein n=1 Tax=Stieleria maiorica TaxID=2795974 RepID=A0A5B9MRH4_9BACT|nr:hypothetical protein Mal15_67880 [Stieleria maiorica]